MHRPPRPTSRPMPPSVYRREWPCEPERRAASLGGIQRRSQRLLDCLTEFIELESADIRAGGCDHLGLIDRDVRDGKAFHFGRVARDETRGPCLIVIGAGCQRMPAFK